MPSPWRLSGEYLENCNCEVLCPCIVDNVRHFAARRLAIARATRSSYTDHGQRWDHTDRNGHYAPFEWKGP